MKIQTKPSPKSLKSKTTKVKITKKKTSKFMSKSKLEKLGGKKLKKFNKVKKIEKDASEDDDEGSGEDDELFTKVEHEESDEESDEGDTEDERTTVNTHKKQLSNLKKSDPEFYQFLQENEKQLLNFGVSDDEDDDEENNGEDKYHTLPDKLEGPSDESEIDEGENEDLEGTEEVSEGTIQGKPVTLKMVSKWQDELETDKTHKTLQEIVDAFHAALASISPNVDKSNNKYSVKGSSVFNAILQLCLFHIQPAIRKLLRIPASGRFELGKCKKWVKIRNTVKFYVANVYELLSGVTSEHVSSLLLKHLHQLSPFVVYDARTSNKLLRRLIKLWCTSNEDTVRVLSFLCVLRMCNCRKMMLEVTIKSMYMSYIRNCKFVSPTTLPGINFMRRSLVEILSLDPTVTYQHAFLYIRQLAINLRNAVTLCKKETFQTVYNWQYVNCLKLWSDLLRTCDERSELRSLVYPLVQITIGTIKLVPTAQFYPLRFHCLRTLTTLSQDTGVFIPVLPFLLEILDSYDFNKKHKKMSTRPLDLTCVLRCSKLQMQENTFKDAVVEELNNLFLHYLSVESHRIAFPDLVLTTVLQLKQFLKTCKVTNYCKKMKSVLEKVEENCRFVEVERKRVAMNLADVEQVRAWETSVRLKTTPLVRYYEEWNKVHMRLQAKKLSDNDQVGDYKLPALIKRKRLATDKDDGPVTLFPSDDEDDDDEVDGEDDEEDEPPLIEEKSKKKIKKTKTIKKKKIKEETEDNINDEVNDLNMADWSDDSS